MKSMMTVMMISALMAPFSASAQDPGDSPDHSVARISVLSGDVTVRRGDTGDLIEAELNEPLVSRDHVLTEGLSGAEIQFDSTTMIRVAPESEVRLAELRDGDYLVQVVAGTVTLRVLRDSRSHIEVSTPAASLVPRDDGTYRITVYDDSSTWMTVRAGDAEVLIENTRDDLRAGQTLFVKGDPSNPQRAYQAAIPLDDWDRWNESRDRDLTRNDSYQYVSRDIYGAEDLVDHGRWVYDAPYGWVWVPRVDAAWAPYRVGRWSWIDYYGWTWVSGDPWGWAPYHYGRWYYGPRYGWAWYPGGITVRYTWRPALVAFFGWGTNIGWVPLAPYEVYRPWYGSSRTVYVNNVTVVNHIDVVNTYHNARFVSGRSGVTSLSSGDFGRHRITVNNYISGTDRDFTRASDAGRLLAREPDRGYRQPANRRNEERNNGRTVADNPRPGEGNRSRPNVVDATPSRPAETVRRTQPPRQESFVTNRGEPSRSRPSENSGSRIGASNAQPSRTPEETVRRTQPRRDESVVTNRGEPSRSRPSENSGSRIGASNAQPSRTPEETVRRTQPRRDESAVTNRVDPSPSRPSENSGSRIGASNGQPSRTPEETVRRTQPRRDGSAVTNRVDPSPSRPSENSGSRIVSSPQPSGTPEEAVRRTQSRRDDSPNERNEPSRGRSFEGASRSVETASREPRRSDPVITQRDSPRGRPSDNERSRVETPQRADPPRGEPQHSRPDNNPPQSSSPASPSQGQGQSQEQTQSQGQPQGNSGRGRGNGR